MRNINTLLSFLLVFLASYASGQVYVSQFAVNGNNDGTSWGDAYLELSDALEQAAPGSEVWIALGEYFPGEVVIHSEDENIKSDTTHAFIIDKDLKIYGGFIGNETNVEQRNSLLNPVILNGDINGDDISSRFDTLKNDNAHHILFITDTVTNETVIDGLFIWRGYADAGDSYAGSEGGGIYCEGTPVIQNCTVNSCFAEYGGGMAIFGSIDMDDNQIGSVSILSSDFDMNRAEIDGAGLYIEDLQRTIILDSKVSRSISGEYGAIFVDNVDSLIIQNSSIRDNESSEYSALYVGETDHVTLIGCDVLGNHALSFVTVQFDGDAVSTIENTRVLYNTADTLFAGIASENPLRVINSVIGGNEALEGAIVGQVASLSELTFMHSTVAGSASPTITAEGFLTTTNSIFYNDGLDAFGGSADIVSGGGNLCSDATMDSGLTESTDQTNTDPLFADFDGGDFKLQAGSPAINAAVPSSITEDVEGVVRDSLPDVGAYEWFLSATAQTEIPELEINVWPTITQQSINVEYMGADRPYIVYQVIDLQGRVLTNGFMENSKFTLNVSDYSAGQYQVIFRSDKGVTTRSFIKQ